MRFQQRLMLPYYVIRAWRTSRIVRYCGTWHIVRYRGRGDTKYQFPNDCYVIQADGKRIGYFEYIRFEEPQRLLIEHFAVDGSMKGNGIGEQLLRGFANLIQTKAPQVTCISFALRQAAPGSNIAQLAGARVALFRKIKAESVLQNNLAPDYIVVSADWHKNQW